MHITHVLVAEDDIHIRTGLVDTLESEGYHVTEVCNGMEAIACLEKDHFDLLLLDIMMPEKSGFDVCRHIRAKNQTLPIIMLTAKGEEIDKVVGLQLGADDYITKPFGINELLARISAVLRRCQRNMPSKSNASLTFTFAGMSVNSSQYKLIGQDGEMDLTQRELKLLHLFHKHPGEVLSREKLLNEVWGIDYYGTTRTLDQHISQLRKKVESDPSTPRVITTVHGVGYRYNTQKKEL